MSDEPKTTPEPPLAEPAARQICDWIVETCLTFGASLHTAYKVAGFFIEGVRYGGERK